MPYLLDVPPGEFTLVHRARTGTGKPVNSITDAAWTEYDGERALVTALVLTDPAAP